MEWDYIGTPSRVGDIDIGSVGIYSAGFVFNIKSQGSILNTYVDPGVMEGSWNLEPGVPGGIHAAKVICAARGRYQSPHLHFERMLFV